MAKILLATDADWLRDEVVAALEGPNQLLGVRSGREIAPAVAATEPDLVICDLQIGSMGGMAATMALRLEAGAGRLPPVKVLLLLDRRADLFLAQRCGADGWLVKPLDALRLRAAVHSVLAGSSYTEGLVEPVDDDWTGDDPDAEPESTDTELAGSSAPAAG